MYTAIRLSWLMSSSPADPPLISPEVTQKNHPSSDWFKRKEQKKSIGHSSDAQWTIDQRSDRSDWLLGKGRGRCQRRDREALIVSESNVEEHSPKYSRSWKLTEIGCLWWNTHTISSIGTEEGSVVVISCLTTTDTLCQRWGCLSSHTLPTASLFHIRASSRVVEFFLITFLPRRPTFLPNFFPFHHFQILSSSPPITVIPLIPLLLFLPKGLFAVAKAVGVYRGAKTNKSEQMALS